MEKCTSISNGISKNMNNIELILRFFAGGSLITILTLITKTKNPFLAGVFMLFPAVTLVGFYFIAQSVDAITLKKITLFGIFGIPTTFVFLLLFYVLQSKTALHNALIGSIIMWGLMAVIVIFADKELYIISDV